MSPSSRTPRIIYLITDSGFAGAERQVHDLAIAMASRGWSVGAISMLPLDEQFADLAALNIRTGSLNMSRGVPDPRALLRLRRLLREWKPDVLHGHMVHANLLARLSRLLVHTPVVLSTMHNQDEGSQWRYYAYRLTDRLNDLTTTVSALAVAEAVRRHAVSIERIRLVPNGIVTDGYQPDPAARAETRASLGVQDDFVWLALGRLDEAKDYPNMIAAFERIATDRPEARLLIAGAGPLEKDLASWIQAAGLAGRAVPLGLRTDAPRLLQAADGYVLSSAWEGLPMVLLEAGASELPVVATDVGGSRDAVLDDVSGFLVPARAPERLAEAMARLMSLTPAERALMGASGRNHIQSTFEMEKVADRWDALYREFLPSSGRIGLN